MRSIHLTAVMIALSLFATAAQALIVVHQYDFEPTHPNPGAVTQAGWTHVQWNTNYTTSTAGFDPARTAIYYQNLDEPSQTATPYTEMQRDWVGTFEGYNPSVGGIVFREIVPANAGYVSFTIWRNSVDGYNPVFVTSVQLGDSTGTIFTTRFTHGGYNPAPSNNFDDNPNEVFDVSDRSVPITGSFNFAPLTTTRYLDFVFDVEDPGSDFYEFGVVRLNGIQTTFPEPTLLAVFGMAGVFAMRRR